MTEILKIGRLLKTDKDGYIVSESSAEKIASPWKEAVEEIKNAYLSHLGDIVHSIYVRGTVSRGEAIESISDIDTFAVITKKQEEIDRSWVKKLEKPSNKSSASQQALNLTSSPTMNYLTAMSYLMIDLR